MGRGEFKLHFSTWADRLNQKMDLIPSNLILYTAALSSEDSVAVFLLKNRARIR